MTATSKVFLTAALLGAGAAFTVGLYVQAVETALPLHFV
jgi:hypothetical protein